MKALLALTAVLVLAGCASVTSPPETAEARQAAGTLDVRATGKQLTGKTPAEVLPALGRPEREYGNEHWEWWIYENKFYDGVTGKTLGTVTVVFHDGKVVDLTY
jgi:hypothetical protein